MKTALTTQTDGLDAFLSGENEMGVCVFSNHGGIHITLDEFFRQSFYDMSETMKIKYALEFERIAKKIWPREAKP